MTNEHRPLCKEHCSGGNTLSLVMCADCSDPLFKEKHQWFLRVICAWWEVTPESTVSWICFPESLVFSGNTAESTWLSALWSGKYFTRAAAAAFTGNGRGDSFKLILWAVLNPDLSPPWCAPLSWPLEGLFEFGLSCQPLPLVSSLFFPFFLSFFWSPFKAPLLQKLSNGQDGRALWKET